jgi:thiamine pyrophosphokinase
MRALLVAAAPIAGSAYLVAELAAVCDPIIAIDGGGAVCLEAGVSPDVVLGDFDSLAPAALERLAARGSRVIEFPSRKNQTDLELALLEARERGAAEVVLTCSSSGRLDHTLAALGALATNADLCPMLAEPDVTGWVLAPSGRTRVTLKGVGATVSLLALGGPASVSAAGVEWPLAGFELLPGSSLGVSNVITAPTGAEISVDRGTLLVLAPFLPGEARAADR